MSRATTVRWTLYGALAVGTVITAVAMPIAAAQPTTPAPAPVPVEDCTAVGLSNTLSSVTASLSEYFAAHPQTNQALIDFSRQPAFVAAGQFDSYFRDRPQEANDLRAIQAPLNEFKSRCGMQVTPAEALTVLANL